MPSSISADRTHDPAADRSDRWLRALAELVSLGHRVEPDELAAAVDRVVRPLGVGVTIHLVDVEQRTLRALGRPDAAPLDVSTTLPGRVFSQLRAQARDGSPGRLWMPVVDGTDRLGVLEVAVPPGVDPADPEVREGSRLIASAVGHLVAGKSRYGDRLQRVTRSRPMSVSAELLRQALPPLTAATGRTVVSGLLEPCYEVGGDAFDYSIDADGLWLAILDGVGHGLPAAVTTTVTLAALRAGRRAGLPLPDVGRMVDETLTAQWDDHRFVTAVLARLDLRSGLLRYVNAGHPPPLLLRQGRVVRALRGGRRLPLGLPGRAGGVGEERLEPGDRLLLHTDGVTDAQDASGEMFGLDRLVELTERCTGTGLPTAETTRRITHAVVAHQDGPLRDDATLLLLEWSPEAARRSEP